MWFASFVPLAVVNLLCGNLFIADCLFTVYGLIAVISDNNADEEDAEGEDGDEE